MTRKRIQSSKPHLSAECTRMRELRLKQGLTQEAVAEHLGMAQNSYSRLETGEHAYRRATLLALSMLYGLHPEEAFPSYFVTVLSAAG